MSKDFIFKNVSMDPEPKTHLEDVKTFEQAQFDAEQYGELEEEFEPRHMVTGKPSGVPEFAQRVYDMKTLKRYVRNADAVYGFVQLFEDDWFYVQVMKVKYLKQLVALDDTDESPVAYYDPNENSVYVG
jgi:hypothetical protein